MSRCPYIRGKAWEDHHCGISGASVTEDCGTEEGSCPPRHALAVARGELDLEQVPKDERDWVRDMAARLEEGLQARPNASNPAKGLEAEASEVLAGMPYEQLELLRADLEAALEARREEQIAKLRALIEGWRASIAQVQAEIRRLGGKRKSPRSTWWDQLPADDRKAHITKMCEARRAKQAQAQEVTAGPGEGQG